MTDIVVEVSRDLVKVLKEKAEKRGTSFKRLAGNYLQSGIEAERLGKIDEVL